MFFTYFTQLKSLEEGSETNVHFIYIFPAGDSLQLSCPGYSELC